MAAALKEIEIMNTNGKIGVVGAFALATGNAIGGATWTLPVVAASEAGPAIVITTLALFAPIFLLLPAYISL